MADPNIKVGSGYIEIGPKLVGFNRELTRTIARKLKASGSADVVVSPVLHEKFEERLKRKVKAAIKRVGPFSVEIEASLNVTKIRQTATAANEAAQQAVQRGYRDLINDVRDSFSQLSNSIAAGWVKLTDPQVLRRLGELKTGLNVLYRDQEKLTQGQFNQVRAGLAEIERMHARIDRARNQTAGTDQLVTRLNAIRQAARQVEVQVRSGFKSFRDPSVLRFLSEMRQEITRLSSGSGKMNPLQLSALSSSLGDVDRVISQVTKQMEDGGRKAADGFVSAFQGGIGGAFATVMRFAVANFLVGLVAVLAAAPLVASALSAVAGVVMALASSAAYAAGSLLALPAVFAAVAQASAVVMAGFWGIQDALSALQSAEDQSGASAQAAAAAREAAAERVADAQARLADVQLASIERVESAQARLAEVQEQAAERVLAAQDRLADSQSRLAEAQESALERVSSAVDRLASQQARLVDLQEQAARRIEDAQARVIEAQESGAERVASAERRLQDAHARTRDALDDLNRARAEAKERLEDLRLELEGGAIDEEEAQQRIAEAAQELELARNNPNATAEERRALELKHKQAIQRLKEIQEKNGDLREEMDRFNRDGIEGTDDVISARKRLQDAQQDELDQERALAKARVEAVDGVRSAEDALAETRRDAARSVADGLADIARAERDIEQARRDGQRGIDQALKAISDAERDLTKARQEGARSVAEAEAAISKARVDGAKDVERAQRELARALDDQRDSLNQVSAASRNAELALNQLSPAGRSFVLFLHNELLPKIREIQWAIQDAFLPPIEEALRKSGPLLDVLKDGLTETGGILGDLTGKFIEFMSSDFFTGRVKSIMDTNNELFRELDGVAEDLAEGLLVLADSAAPFLKWVVKLVKEFANWFSETMKQKEASGQLKTFWTEVQKTLEIVIRIAGNLGRALANIFVEGKPAGDSILTLIQDLTGKFADWTGSVEGKTWLKDFFARAVEVAKEMAKLVEDIVKWFADMSDSIDVADLVRTFREEILPPIRGLVDIVDKLLDLLGLLKPAFDALNAPIQLVSGALKLVTGDSEGAEEAFKSMADSAAEFVAEQLDNFGIKVPRSYEEMKKSAEDAARSVRKWWDETVASVKKKIGEFLDSIPQAFEDLKAAGSRKMSEIIQNIKDWWNQLPAWVQQFFIALGQTIRMKLGVFYDIGKEILLGLWNGLASRWDAFVDWITGGINNVVDWIKRSLGIASPSRVFRSIGQNIGDGLALGIQSTEKSVSKAAFRLASTVTDSFGVPELQFTARGSASSGYPNASVLQSALMPSTLKVSDIPAPARSYNVTLNAAPSIPSEKQVINALAYADALYG
ncbi:hypothetical protein ACFWY5_29860 [Nonomuraea sp. NPDC059007]|uniref:hypothetical protein n=1 Tax=Nonomuraea sp. NPDC059007 TaxID=3346692 RepID=UPI003680361D